VSARSAGHFKPDQDAGRAGGASAIVAPDENGHGWKCRLRIECREPPKRTLQLCFDCRQHVHAGSRLLVGEALPGDFFGKSFARDDAVGHELAHAFASPVDILLLKHNGGRCAVRGVVEIVKGRDVGGADLDRLRPGCNGEPGKSDGHGSKHPSRPHILLLAHPEF